VERREPAPGRLDQFFVGGAARVIRGIRKRRLGLRRLVRAVNAHGREMGKLRPGEVKQTADTLRHRLRAVGFEMGAVSQIFALVREVAERSVGMRHFDVQVMGGWVLLNGMIVEMETGEGKTLAATLPACTAALAGCPVHVITVNDYLAARDADQMGPIYRALGLTVGVIQHGMDPDSRRAAYACDVTYGTNKEVAFDYLKDRIVLGRNPSRIRLHLESVFGREPRMPRLLLRGLAYAIVDEADSVLVDEARTPLIISGSANGTPDRRVYDEALALAAELEAARDFLREGRQESVRLTPVGQERLAGLAEVRGGIWTASRRREELVQQALTALHVMQRDRHYLVKDGGIQIIDEYTGRAMPDRQWEYGLHQLVEAKEGCELTNPNEPLARISYQRFFRRYLRLAGMTGTAMEVRREVWSVYRLPVVRVPTNRPLHRRSHGKRIYRTADAKWAAVVARIVKIHEQGRPVLVGTRSVEASERLSGMLSAVGLTHRVLNARQDDAEAEIIARAGEQGIITVATNMAGRGTDIKLGSGVVELGGLHVIATEAHEARRIDRQLYGRCGRQGDPGTYEMLLSLEDPLMTVHARAIWRWFFISMGRSSPMHTASLGKVAVRRAQTAAERLHSRIRRDLLKQDEYLDTALAFSGRFE